MATDDGSTQTPEANEQLSRLMTEVIAAKERAETAAGAAEEANRKANSESGFAFNAKQNAEDHAKAISQVRGTVDADFNWLTTTKSNADEAAQAIGIAKTKADSDLQSVAAAKATAERDASLAATASSAITKIQGDISSAWTRASEESASVTQAKATVEASATVIQTLQTQAAEKAAKIDSDATTIAGREVESKNIVQSMAEAATSATQAQARVLKYEQDLAKLRSQFQELHAKTEALLPGATSAGLASAFRDQKARFDQPQRNWLYTFMAAVLFFLLAGLIGLPGVRLLGGPQATTWDAVLLHVTNRLPLVVPLVWLGIYAGRNYMLALRMQEEYAFKEALSATFEGYKREMAGIPGSEAGASPLLKLCENVLLALAERPGRIYESRHEDITPWQSLTNFFGTKPAKAEDPAKTLGGPKV